VLFSVVLIGFIFLINKNPVDARTVLLATLIFNWIICTVARCANSLEVTPRTPPSTLGLGDNGWNIRGVDGWIGPLDVRMVLYNATESSC
jgi:hypothetical protein